MKVEELFKTQPYQIYQDLDGCLVAFNEFAETHMGINPYEWDIDKKAKSNFWKRVNRWVKDGKPFFSAMELKSDAKTLWEYIEHYDPIILSATGHIKNAEQEKREWIKRHIGERYSNTAILVKASQDKAEYATPYSILIDDRTKSIDPWVAKGGIGILHVSAEDTIEQLNSFGL